MNVCMYIIIVMTLVLLIRNLNTLSFFYPPECMMILLKAEGQSDGLHQIESFYFKELIELSMWYLLKIIIY